MKNQEHLAIMTYDPRVREAVARSFKSEVDEWSRAGNVSGDVLEDIAAALAHASSWDGFDLARELQREGRECNFELCEILEGAYYRGTQALDGFVAEWVRANDIKPALKVGDAVQIVQHRVTYRGEIASVNTGQALYTVFVPDLGHVREGIGTHGTILPFEMVVPAGDAVTAQAQEMMGGRL